MSLTLYYHPLSSFCHKVLVGLYEHGVYFEKREINLGDEADRATLTALWPFTKFPVLSDQRRGRDVAESSIIIEYVDHHSGDNRKMIPADWEDALEVRLWDRVFDAYVHAPMQAIVANRIRGGSADMAAERAMIETAYRMIERRMAGRKWVAGKDFSMADCAAVPALFYANTVSPFPDDCVNVQSYYERLMTRPSVARVLEEAKPYFGMYPFADAIPERFR